VVEAVSQIRNKNEQTFGEILQQTDDPEEGEAESEEELPEGHQPDSLVGRLRLRQRLSTTQ